MKILLNTVFAVVLLVFSQSVGAETLKIRIATEGAYPPFSEVNAAGELVGFDLDIANAICETLNAECEITAQDWDGIIPGLLANKYDAIIASMSITEERMQTVSFSDKYYSNSLAFYAKRGSGISSMEGLNGKTIGAQRASIAGQWLEDNLGGKVSVKLYDTQTAANSDLKSGRLDVVISDIYPAHDWVKENNGFDFVLDPIDINDKIGVAVRKDDKKLRDLISRAIEVIRQNGTYHRINAEYFPFDIY